jgi:hypothetical protein
MAAMQEKFESISGEVRVAGPKGLAPLLDTSEASAESSSPGRRDSRDTEVSFLEMKPDLRVRNSRLAVR